jgi:ATP-dependent RNA helicase DeaD
MNQRDRDRVFADLRSGNLQILVATDVVGRGIDVSTVSHIINFDIPLDCDDYVHRVGRTGRMGRDGIAFTFVTADEGEQLTSIELNINRLLIRDSMNPEELNQPSRTLSTIAAKTVQSAVPENGEAGLDESDGEPVIELPKKRRLFPVRRRAGRR